MTRRILSCNALIINMLKKCFKKLKKIKKKSIDSPVGLACICPVMKKFFRTTVLGVCLVGFVAALVTPAQAARTGGSVIIAPPIPKPVISRY